MAFKLHRYALDIAGGRSGSLVAIRPMRSDERGLGVVWECRCDCGATVERLCATLRANKTSACGECNGESAARRLAERRGMLSWEHLDEANDRQFVRGRDASLRRRDLAQKRAGLTFGPVALSAGLMPYERRSSTSVTKRSQKTQPAEFQEHLRALVECGMPVQQAARFAGMGLSQALLAVFFESSAPNDLATTIRSAWRASREQVTT